ncbi:MAG TPA: NAD(P)H-hydrate dehydratase [Longimicrobiaceae bacterium]|nr:NAD(P)H-hydrate dehydratase [Longimicrobiaceae bacterium]
MTRSDSRRNVDVSPSGWPSVVGRADVPLLTADAMRDWDRNAQEEHGIPERVLLESAGRAAARVLHHLYPEGRGAAAVGHGNNGGDALVLLRALRAWGREVVAVPAGGEELPAHLLHGWEIDTAPAEEAATVFRSAAVVIDGILGTGAQGAPREPQATMIERINAAGRPVLALDGPSGVDLTTGQTPGVAIRAEVTVTFGAPKRGLLLFPGREHAGRIVVVEVGFPPLVPRDAGAAVVTPWWASARLPSIPANAHKGTTGTVVVLAGRSGMAGAAVLVGTAAARAGAGLVQLVSPAENRVILQTSLPEALFTAREEEGLGEMFADSDAIVAGPGMGTDDSALQVLRQVLETGDAPLVLDADALTLLARHPELEELVGRRSVLLTPHPGEMSHLAGAEVKEIVSDPFRFAAEIAERFGCALLLKGAPSLVASPGTPTLANVVGHSGIATGGMGDTLAGIAGALLAMGCSPREAGALALFLSGRAAEIAGRGRSLLPRDIDEALDQAFADLRSPASHPLPEVLLDLQPAR